MVESTRLESEHTGNRIVGSNPTLSAIPFESVDRTMRSFGDLVRQGYGRSTIVLD